MLFPGVLPHTKINKNLYFKIPQNTWLWTVWLSTFWLLWVFPWLSFIKFAGYFIRTNTRAINICYIYKTDWLQTINQKMTSQQLCSSAATPRPQHFSLGCLIFCSAVLLLTQLQLLNPSFASPTHRMVFNFTFANFISFLVIFSIVPFLLLLFICYFSPECSA